MRIETEIAILRATIRSRGVRRQNRDTPFLTPGYSSSPDPAT